MTLDTVTYLLQFYWPYMAGAGLVGLAAGWFSVRGKK